MWEIWDVVGINGICHLVDGWMVEILCRYTGERMLFGKVLLFCGAVMGRGDFSRSCSVHSVSDNGVIYANCVRNDGGVVNSSLGLSGCYGMDDEGHVVVRSGYGDFGLGNGVGC